MKRDMQVVKKVLELHEELETDKITEDKVIEHHTDICFDAGFLASYEDPENEGKWIIRLTWQGHDFLQTLRTTQGEVKERMKEYGRH